MNVNEKYKSIQKVSLAYWLFLSSASSSSYFQFQSSNHVTVTQYFLLS